MAFDEAMELLEDEEREEYRKFFWRRGSIIGIDQCGTCMLESGRNSLGYPIAGNAAAIPGGCWCIAKVKMDPFHWYHYLRNKRISVRTAYLNKFSILDLLSEV